MNEQNCPCGSDKTYDRCCGRFISGQEYAKTPEQLMRSRYSAYALGGHGRYLLDTWFPATARGLNEQMLDETEVKWLRLEVLERAQKGDKGSVEFKAYYRDEDAPDGQVALHERSEFVRIQGRWLYVGGRVS